LRLQGGKKFGGEEERGEKEGELEFRTLLLLACKKRKGVTTRQSPANRKKTINGRQKEEGPKKRETHQTTLADRIARQSREKDACFLATLETN